jgi:CheY-like chemotaxis protein
VVVLDLNMPGMDGRQLLRIAAEEGDLAMHQAFVVVTASQKILPLHVATLMTTLCVPVLTKPFDIDDLLRFVATAEQRLIRSN